MNTTHRPLAGTAYCVFALLCFAVQDSLVKMLADQYAVLQILWIRSLVALLILVLVGQYLLGSRVFKATRLWPMVLRGVLAFLAFGTYYLALTRIPLADAAAVYMTAPLFVTMLSVPLLGERVGWHRWLAVTCGFGAVVIMLNPGSALFRVEAAMPLFSALCYALIPILSRKIGFSEHALTIAIYTTTSFLLLCLMASMIVYSVPPTVTGNGLTGNLLQRWSLPAPGDFLLMALAGAVFTIGLLCITQAYRVAIVSSVAPFEYSYLIWASLLGFMVFGDVPGVRTVLGSAAVVACGCYVLYREHVRRGT
jgi:drug/metabolite transporter (DMT)-like permease